MAVYVVGSVNADLILPVAHLPAPGATILSGDPQRLGGGKGGNVAVAAARDGNDVTLVAAFGDDDLAPGLIAELEADGVDMRRAVTLEGRPSGLAMICVDPHGENFIVVAPGANAGLAPEHVTGALDGLTAGDVCVVNFEIPDETVAALVAVVADAGARLVMNPSPVRPVDHLTGARTTLVLNAGEVRELSGDDAVETGAATLRARGFDQVVVTLGGDGVYVLDADGTTERIAAFPATPVDTTGAGDTFTGVLAGALAHGEPLAQAARRGAAAGALSTEAVGARGGMPRRTATDRLVGGR